MSDRELLELAAKAAGIELWVEWDSEGPLGSYRIGREDGDIWNPLTDDGDALRLAVKLRIVVDYYERHRSTECACAAWAVAASGGAEHEEIGTGPCAAVRRAIVRAAAAMAAGRSEG